MSDQLEQDAADALAEAMAAQFTEDPEKRMLITEGLRRIWQRKTEVQSIPDLMSRFYVEGDNQGTMFIWDFAVLCAYMDCVESYTNGWSEVHNARTGETKRLAPKCTVAFKEYLLKLIPNLKESEAAISELVAKRKNVSYPPTTTMKREQP